MTWINRAEVEEQPIPIVAGLAHYQFVTIHPFYDGNGRTARADHADPVPARLRPGRFYSLEEVYAHDLPAYYAALQTHPHHNYYEGRADADLTAWLAYFVHGMAAVFQRIGEELRSQHEQPALVEPPELHRLDRRARVVLGLFSRQETITAADAARALGLSPAQYATCSRFGWLKVGWTLPIPPANHAVTAYRRNIGGLSAE